MKKIWFDEAWEDYILFPHHDTKTLKPSTALLTDLES